MPAATSAPRLLVLASASPARLRVLRDAGLDPEVQVSGVPEDGLDHLSPEKIAGILAERKATAVADRLRSDDAYARALIIGCDSVFDLDGQPLGKPDDAQDAVARWQQMRGRVGRLHTGHHVIDLAGGATAGEVATTVVRFASPDDAEIDGVRRVRRAALGRGRVHFGRPGGRVHRRHRRRSEQRHRPVRTPAAPPAGAAVREDHRPVVLKIGPLAVEPAVVLAPMAGVTNAASAGCAVRTAQASTSAR